MRTFITILLLFIFTHGWAQVQQPVYIGEANWVKEPKHHVPTILPMTVTKYRMTKKVTLDNKPSIFQRKIVPGTRVISNSSILPVTGSVEFIGKKFIAPPEKFDAPPLVTRDNVEFNVSYSDKRHGFIAASTIDFAEDDQHNIWMSVPTGLIRYDGYHYFLYTLKTGLPNEIPGSLAFDKQKRLWMTTGNGIYFIRNDSVFTLKSREINFSGIPGVRVLTHPNGQIWLSTRQNGAICIENTTIKIYDKRCGLPSNDVMYTHLDKKENLWLALHDSGVISIRPNKMLQFFNRPNAYGRSQFSCLYENKDGMWMGSFLSGMMRMSATDTIQYSLNGRYDDNFYDIKKGPADGLWVSTYGGSVSYLNKNKIISITASNGLIDRSCMYLFEDSFKNLWVSNLVTGFSRINENALYIQGFENPAIGNVKTIIPDANNGRWIMTFGRSLLYQKGNITTAFIYLRNKYQPFGNNINGVLNKDGTLWITSNGEGIVLVNDPFFSTYHFSNFFDNQIIRSINSDGKGRVWICPSDFGLILYDQKKFWHYSVESGLLSHRVGHIYLGLEKRIYLEVEEGFQRFSDPGFETFYIGNTRLRDQVNCMLDTDDSTKLIGTDLHGLLLIQNQKVYQLKIKNDLSFNTVKTITRDVKGRIWISSEKDIECLVIKGASVLEHTIFNTNNGPYLTMIEDVLLDSSGMPYWVTREKKIVYNPDFHIYRKPPIFSIKEILVNGKPADTTKRISALPNEKISIHFTAIFWGRENNLKIKYLLVSNKGDTSEKAIDSRDNIIISDVSPGSYRLIITAHDNNIVYYAPTLLLQLNDYWYNTWLFRAGIFCLLIGTIVIYFRKKSRRQKKANEILEIKVAEQTRQIKEEKEEILKNYQVINLQNQEKDILIQEINHRVKNNLQIIAAMVEMQINSDNKKDAEQSLRGTARRLSAMSLVHEMLYENKNVKGLSIKKYFEELVEHLKEMANNYENPVHFDLSSEDIIIDSRSAIALGMIISELVSNSLKHAFKNITSPKITVSLDKDPLVDKLRLLVGDNGNGIGESDDLKKGLGSRLVDIFSRQLQGTYSINSIDHFVFILYFKPPGT